MTLPAAVLAFGGAVSFLLGAVTGFWLGAWMKRNPGQGPHRYRMVAHKEALWSCFLCFALAGWIDELPLPELVALGLAVCVVLTGWFAIVQYYFVASAELKDGVNDDPPWPARLCGAGAMGVNLLAIAGLLAGTGAALLGAL